MYSTASLAHRWTLFGSRRSPPGVRIGGGQSVGVLALDVVPEVSQLDLEEPGTLSVAAEAGRTRMDSRGVCRYFAESSPVSDQTSISTTNAE